MSVDPPRQHEHLLSPGRIGSMELRNRIVLSPMGDDLCNPDGTVSDTQLSYAEARARGGVGLVMLGSVAVAHPRGTSNACQTGISEDRFIPGLRTLADAVHRHGARLALQLTHAGKIGLNDMAAGRPVWVPSAPRPSTADPDPLFAQVTADEATKQQAPMRSPTFAANFHPMTREDIRTAVAWFADAAHRAKAAGVDGVELHAGHGYLLDEFLSPSSNARTDEYGGPIENRARIVVEALQGIRRRVGAEYPVWIRLNADELFIAGTTPADALTTARLVVDAGADALHVSVYADPGRAIGYTEAHATHVPGRFVAYAREIKRQVQVPVIAVGRIDPDLGDRLIADGDCDFVAMGRKLLADPELPRKLEGQRPEDIKPCIYHYRCISNIFVREGVRCAVNPETGRERQLAVTPARHRHTVLVVGAGPAGLEAARLAAARGHDVILTESSDRLGGKLVYAARTYGPNADLLQWLTRQVEVSRIDVRLNTTVDSRFAVDCGAGKVIVAAGGLWTRPATPGADAAHVKTIDQLDSWLLRDEPLPAQSVAVLGGGRAGLALADLASRQGHHVTVIEEGPVFAPQIGQVGRWRFVHELLERKVEMLSGTTVTAIAEGQVQIVASHTSRSIDADLVLVASHLQGRQSLVDEITRSGLPVHTIGDCRSPGFLEGAMLDAAQTAVAL